MSNHLSGYRHHSLRASVYLSAILAIWIALPGFCSQGDKIKFTFDPPNGTTAVETRKTVLAMDGGYGLKSTDTVEARDTLTFTRNGNGFTVKRSPMITSNTTYDGRKTGEGAFTYMHRLAEKAPLVYQLNEYGECTQLFGLEEYIKRLARTKPAGVSEDAIASLQSCQEQLVAQAITDWNNLAVVFAGREAQVGDTWKVKLENPLPGGGVAAVTVDTKVVGWVESGGRRWLEVRSNLSCPDCKAVLEAMSRTYSKMSTTDAEKAAASRMTALRFKGTDTKLVDPSTMLYLSHKLDWLIESDLDLGASRKTTVSIRQVTEQSFAYDLQSVAAR